MSANDPRQQEGGKIDQGQTGRLGSLIHRDLGGAGEDETARGADGQRLDHAEGTSQPLRPTPEPEPKNAIATSRGDRPINQALAAKHFIAATEHAKMHDERLWDLRKKRDR